MENYHALSLRQLRLVEILGEVQSIQIAASSLRITQSAATKSLQKVESLFGAQLFYRTSKGLLPTRAGILVIEHAQAMMRIADQAEKDVRYLENGSIGELRIGVPSGASRAAFSKAAIQHSEAYSNVTVKVKEAASAELYAMLVRRELDCIIGRRGSQSEIPGVQFVPLYTDIFCICVRPGHCFAGQPKIKLSDLTESNWILPHGGTSPRKAIDASFIDAGLSPPRCSFEALGAHGQELLLVSDMIGVWPYQAVRSAYIEKKIDILKIALPRTLIEVGLAFMLEGERPRFFEGFCTAVKAAGHEIDVRQSEWRSLFSF